jgi:hypothetical protein
MSLHADDRYVVVSWIDAELKEARQIQAELDKRAEQADYADLDLEVARHEQAGWINAFEYIQREIVSIR